MATPAQPGARRSALASDVAQVLQALGLLAKGAGDNVDAERADMTSAMASAAEELAARRARGGGDSGDPGARLEPLALEAVASPARSGALDVA